MKITYEEYPSISTTQVRDIIRAFREQELILRDNRGREGRLLRASDGKLHTDSWSCRNCDYREIEVVFDRELIIRCDEYPDLTIDELVLHQRHWHGVWGCPVTMTITGRWGDIHIHQAPFGVLDNALYINSDSVRMSLPIKGYYWIRMVPRVATR